MSNGGPQLTFVLPVLNEDRHLDETMASLRAQDVDPATFEVLLYDGGSVDATLRIAEVWRDRMPNLQIFRNPERLPCFARNAGVAAARGTYIALIEGHCVLPPVFARRALELFQTTGADALGRPLTLWFPDDPRQARAIAMARQSVLGHDFRSLLYGDYEGFADPLSSATVYRREVFAIVGMFDKSFYVGEDVDFNHRMTRAGLTHFFAQDLRCGYRPRRSIGSLLHQMRTYGVGRMQIVAKHDCIAVLPQLLPLIACTLLLLSLVAALVSRQVWVAAPALVYVLAVIVEGCRMAARFRDLAALPLVPVAISAVHVGLAFGIASGLGRRVMARKENAA